MGGVFWGEGTCRVEGENWCRGKKGGKGRMNTLTFRTRKVTGQGVIRKNVFTAAKAGKVIVLAWQGETRKRGYIGLGFTRAQRIEEKVSGGRGVKNKVWGRNKHICPVKRHTGISPFGAYMGSITIQGGKIQPS